MYKSTIQLVDDDSDDVQCTRVQYNTIGNWLMNCDGLKISISKSTCFFLQMTPQWLGLFTY